MSMKRCVWVLGVLLAVSMVSGAADSTGVIFPDRKLLKAMTRWNMEGKTGRLLEPGPLGQHDLFWQIVRLWEQEEKSRTDPNLTAVMVYLLYDARLAKDPALSTAVSRLVPHLNPSMGGRQVEELISSWLAKLVKGQDPIPPWAEKSFSGMPRKAMAALAQRLLKERQDLTRRQRVGLGALVAIADRGSEMTELGKELDTAGKKVLINRYTATEWVTYWMARSQDPSCLRVLLYLAERDLDEDKVQPREGPRALQEFRRLTFVRGRYPNVRYGSRVRNPPMMDFRWEILEGRLWLVECLARLVKKSSRGKFEGAFPPEFWAAEKARRVYKLQIDPNVLGRHKGYAEMTVAVVDLMERDPKAARDDELCELLMRLAPRSYDEARQTLYVRLPKVNREFGVEAWRRAMQVFLMPGKTFILETQLCWLNKKDLQVIKDARLRLQPEMKELYEAAKKGTPQERLDRALAYLFAGGTIPRKEFKKVLEEGKPQIKGKRVRLEDWGTCLAIVGVKEGLWVLLEAAEMKTDPLKQGLQSVEHYSGLATAEALAGRSTREHSKEERLKRVREWIENHEDLLEHGRFGGFRLPPPGPPRGE